MSMFLTAATNQAIFSFAHRDTPQEPTCQIQARRKDPVYCPHVAAYLNAAGQNGSTLDRLSMYKTSMCRARIFRSETSLRSICNVKRKKIGIRAEIAYMTKDEVFVPDRQMSYRLFTKIYRSMDCGDRSFDRELWKIQTYRTNLATQLNVLGEPYNIGIQNTSVKTLLNYFNKLEMALLKCFVAQDAPERTIEVNRMARDFLRREIVLPSEQKGCAEYLRKKLFRSPEVDCWVKHDRPTGYPEEPLPEHYTGPVNIIRIEAPPNWHLYGMGTDRNGY